MKVKGVIHEVLKIDVKGRFRAQFHRKLITALDYASYGMISHRIDLHVVKEIAHFYQKMQSRIKCVPAELLKCTEEAAWMHRGSPNVPKPLNLQPD